MEALVDAGRLVSVRGSTPRDCVLLALAEVDGAAKWPITVWSGDEKFVFKAGEPGPHPLARKQKRKTKRRIDAK